MDKALDELVSSIKNSFEYKECIRLKEKMSTNTDITSRVGKIKQLQKEYIKTNSCEVKEELIRLNEELNNIPIYYQYLSNLDIVNNKIDFIKDELNDYFYKLLNEDC